jgi:imidazoleglycerol-phosphate dehydratase
MGGGSLVDKVARTGSYSRKTKETDITISLALDGTGKAEISTGIGFFDHMLTALAVHGGFDLSLAAKGDLEVDGHHTVEDCGICLGQALKEALGDRAGIARFGSMLLPMDEALAQVAVDLSGRPYFKYNAEFVQPMTGDYDTSLTREFFQAVATHSGMTLHIRLLEGENDHHATEAIYKAFAHALKQAVSTDGRDEVLSSKGVLA